MLVDTHAHLDYLVRNGTDPAAVMAAAKDAGVAWMVNPSVTPAHFADILSLTEQLDNVFAAAAVHPTDVQDVDQQTWLAQINTMLDHPKVIAIGETGLDYYHDTTHVALQQQFFETLLNLGRERDLPVIIHDRDAHQDVYKTVDACPGVRGVMHCFSGDTAFANQMIAKGFFISFAGNLTFKNAHNLHQAAMDVPLEWMLIETDAPFLTPVPFRGQPNEPGYVRFVAEKIAALKNIPVETVAQVTSENALKVFRPCL